MRTLLSPSGLAAWFGTGLVSPAAWAGLCALDQRRHRLDEPPQPIAKGTDGRILELSIGASYRKQRETRNRRVSGSTNRSTLRRAHWMSRPEMVPEAFPCEMAAACRGPEQAIRIRQRGHAADFLTARRIVAEAGGACRLMASRALLPNAGRPESSAHN